MTASCESMPVPPSKAELLERMEQERADWERLLVLIDTVQDIPEEQLANPDAFAWTGGTALLALIPGQSYDHYAAHLTELRTLADL